ncbi:MAG: efflux RND transporter periplasmic adaptor subunit [Anaerolineae bacterium]|nr:efflux RND transporter periplasmic adaptor subunit [Anaerolineae bacterium]
MNKKRFLVIFVIVAIIVIIVVVAGCRAFGSGENITSLDQLVQKTIKRLAGDDDASLTASGTIQADLIRIAAELGGRITAVEVHKGDPIRQGDVLVRLDDTPLLSKLLEAEAAVATAQANLAVTKAGPRVEAVAAQEALLALAQAQRDGAQTAWNNALAALRNPQDLDAQIIDAQTQINLAEQGVVLAEAELAKQKLIRDQKREGSAEREAADWQVRAAEEKRAAAQIDLATAQTLLDQLQAIRRWPLGLIVQANLAQGQYQVAEASVTVVQAQLDDLLAGPAAEEIAVAEHMVCLQATQAAAIRVQQAKFTLISPIDGVVIDQSLQAGELAAPAATILTVADLSQLILVVYVPVNQIGHIRLGQEACVSVDSFPGRIFTGHVSRVGDEAEYTPRNVATQEERQNTFYAVEIRLPNDKGLLKPGMPADATFQTP